MPLEMTQIILSDIAKLRKMPDLAKRISEYKQQPDPMAQQKMQLEMALLQAQVQNETAKGQENAVDVELKTAKTETERAKARSMHSDSDNKDLDFVDKESGARDMRDMGLADQKHAQNMEGKEYDRLAGLDKTAFDTLTKQ